MEALTDNLKKTLSLAQSQVTLPSFFHQHEITHAATSNAATWKEALHTSTSTPKNAALTKTLVFKPKVGKSQTAVLLVVVALDNTLTNAAQVAKAAHEK